MFPSLKKLIKPAAAHKHGKHSKDAEHANVSAQLHMLDNFYGALKPWLPGSEADKQTLKQNAQHNLRTQNITAKDTLLNELYNEQNGTVRLSRATLHFPEKRSLWTLLNELLINEDYYFESPSKTPHILDCGVHYGLSVYYFKTLHPGAHIVAFEPNPANYAVAQKNIQTNNWKNITLLPYAIDDKAGQATFHTAQGRSMAGSLVHRSEKAHGEGTVVELKPLHAYLPGGEQCAAGVDTVDFIKLDIEGNECRVLEAAKAQLPRVRHLFCEYHEGPSLPASRLPQILNTLNAAGFNTILQPAHNAAKAMAKRPFTQVNTHPSLVLYAQNKNL